MQNFIANRSIVANFHSEIFFFGRNHLAIIFLGSFVTPLSTPKHPQQLLKTNVFSLDVLLVFELFFPSFSFIFFFLLLSSSIFFYLLLSSSTTMPPRHYLSALGRGAKSLIKITIFTVVKKPYF